MEISRGDLITVAIPGDYGKPRPALVIQADVFRALDSVTVLRLTSDLRNSPLLRISVEPGDENGLRTRSQIMIDKATTVRRDKIGQRIGCADIDTMQKVDEAL